MDIAGLLIREEWVHCLPVFPYSSKGKVGDEANSLPQELALKFVMWNDKFLERFELDRGWLNLASYREHVHTAEELAQELRAFLGEDTPVRLGLWATELRGHEVWELPHES